MFHKILITLSFFIVTTANAGLYLEPYVGYNLSGGENTLSISSTSLNGDSDTSGIAYGARVGLAFTGGLILGVDYNISSPDLETTLTNGQFNNNSITTDAMDKTDLGIVVGLNWPVFRLWGTYYLSSEMEDTDSNLGSGQNGMFTNGQVLEGAGYGIGLGYSMLPMISLNLEYKMMNYDTQSGTTGTTFDTTDIDFSEIFVSVSVPFSF